MDVQDFLDGNLALGLALTATLLALVLGGRSFLREIGHDPEAFWRGLARVVVVLIGLLVGWVSAFDNWRQLISLPYRLSRRFPSERVEFDPASASVRAVTLGLLALSLIGVACLLARHVGGYVVQVAVLLAAVVCWAPLFAIRQRFDLGLALGNGQPPTSAADVAGYALYLVMAWLMAIAVILVSYAALVAAVALPITLLLDLTHRRQPRTTSEAAAFFTALGDRAGSFGSGRRF